MASATATDRMFSQQTAYQRDPHQTEYVERFEMDHLISLTGQANVPLDPQDGLHRLKQKEAQNGVVTLRCIVALVVRHNRKEIIVKNRQNGEEMESFPMSLLTTIFFRRSLDPREKYNNKVVIVLAQSPRDIGENIPEMHIFQSYQKPADEVVERINDFKMMKLSSDDYPPMPESEMHISHQTVHHLSTQPATMNHSPSQSRLSVAGGSGLGALPLRGTSGIENGIGNASYSPALSQRTTHGRVDREIYLVNRCFEDIEKFLGRLQKAVRIYNDVNEKLTQRGKNTKRMRQIINYTVSTRAQMPTNDEFVECFKMVKLAVIILARLDKSQTNPNPIDSTHSLFNILEIIANASRDPTTKSLDLARRVVSPLLTAKAVEFLEHTLNSQEKAIWKELGDSWTTPRESWRGQFVPSYLPVFSDGFTPTLWDYEEDIFAQQTTAINGVYLETPQMSRSVEASQHI